MQAIYIIPVVCIIVAVLFSCLSCIFLFCPPEYFHIESLNETNVGVGSVYVATPPKITNNMTVMAVVTIAEHDNFNIQPAAFTHGQSSVWVPADDSFNSRPVVTSAPSINYSSNTAVLFLILKVTINTSVYCCFISCFDVE